MNDFFLIILRRFSRPLAQRQREGGRKREREREREGVDAVAVVKMIATALLRQLG